MFYRIICAGLLLLCTGCYNKARSHSQGQVTPAVVSVQDSQIVGTASSVSNALSELSKIRPEQSNCAYRAFVDEAQLADIPVPDVLLSWYKETLVDPRRHILKYTSNLSVQDCAAFYRVHMEYVGWQEKELFTGNHERCLLFKKPSRIAIITLSTGKATTTRVTVFTGPRKK